MKQEAARKAILADTARRRWPPPRASVDDGSLLLAAQAMDGAASIVSKLHDAIQREEEMESSKLVWALKDLPRDSSLRKAIDSPAGASAKTCLQASAAQGLAEPVKLLLELSPTVNAKDENGKTALHLAAEGNHSKVAQHLLSFGRANVDARDQFGCTALHLAAVRGHKQVGRVLARFGASIEASDSKGR